LLSCLADAVAHTSSQVGEAARRPLLLVLGSLSATVAVGCGFSVETVPSSRSPLASRWLGCVDHAPAITNEYVRPSGASRRQRQRQQHNTPPSSTTSPSLPHHTRAVYQFAGGAAGTLPRGRAAGRPRVRLLHAALQPHAFPSQREGHTRSDSVPRCAFVLDLTKRLPPVVQ
jgi:hypothetical protein